MQFTQKTEKINLMEPLIACLASMVAVSTVFMTQSVFIEISDTFNVDLARTRFVFSVASICYAISFLLFGPAADRFDLQKMSSAGLFFSATGVFGAAISGSFNNFIISMAVIGICASAVAASMFPYMMKIAPKKKQGLYIGLIVAASTTGVVVGRFSVGIMTSCWGLVNTFKIIAVIIYTFSLLTTIVLNGRKIKNAPQAGEKEFKSYLNALKLIISTKLLPLLMTGFFLFFGFLGMVTFLTFRLTDAPFYFTSAEIGWISLAGLTALIGSPLSATIAKKTGVFKIMMTSLSLCLISIQFMGWIPLTVTVFAGILLLFLGVYFCQPLIFLLISRMVPPEYLGTASSFYVLFCIGGGSVSSVALGPVWKLYGWHGVTLICSGSLMIAMALCIKGKKQG